MDVSSFEVDSKKWTLLGAGLGRFRWRGKWKLPSFGEAEMPRRCSDIIDVCIAAFVSCRVRVSLARRLCH
jgi:hypothetical protein